LVVRVEQSVEAILGWSWWRRWHQAHARHHHYQRRTRAEPLPPPRAGVAPPTGVAPPAAVAPQNEMDVVWSRLEPLLPPARRVGHPYEYTRRLVLEAIVHLMQTDCGWRQLPAQFPPWPTVYVQLREWRKTGIWEHIWAGLDQPHPTSELQL